MGFLDKVNPMKIAENKLEEAKSAAQAKMDEMNPANIAKRKMEDAKYAAKEKAAELGNKAKDAAVEKAKEGASLAGKTLKEGMFAPYKQAFGLAKGIVSKIKNKGEETTDDEASQE